MSNDPTKQDATLPSSTESTPLSPDGATPEIPIDSSIKPFALQNPPEQSLFSDPLSTSPSSLGMPFDPAFGPKLEPALASIPGPTQAVPIQESKSQEVFFHGLTGTLVASAESLEKIKTLDPYLTGGIGLYDQAIRNMITLNPQAFLDFICLDYPFRFLLKEIQDTRFIVFPKQQNRIADLMFKVTAEGIAVEIADQEWLLVFENESTSHGSEKLRGSLSQVAIIINQLFHYRNTSKAKSKSQQQEASTEVGITSPDERESLSISTNLSEVTSTPSSETSAPTNSNTESSPQPDKPAETLANQHVEEPYKYLRDPVVIPDPESFLAGLPDGIKVLILQFYLQGSPRVREINHTLGEFGTTHKPIIVEMGKIPAAKLFEFIEKDISGRITVLPLLVLCKQGCEEENLERGRQILENLVELSDSIRKNLKAIIEAFAELKRKQEVCKKYFGEIKMIETPLSKKWYEQAVSGALAEGIDEGMKKGIDEGMKKGIDEGMKKGKIEGKRDLLLLLLQQRFANETLPLEIKARFEKEANPQTFDDWFMIALTSTSLRQFCDGLN